MRTGRYIDTECIRLRIEAAFAMVPRLAAGFCRRSARGRVGWGKAPIRGLPGCLYVQSQHGKVTGSVFLFLETATDVADTTFCYRNFLPLLSRTLSYVCLRIYANQTQQVKINEAAIVVYPTNVGVPLGSVLELGSVSGSFVSRKCWQNMQIQLTANLDAVSQ